MCTNQKYIFTRSRFISPFHRERLLVPIKCGVCSECQTSIRNEWYYRIYHEWLSCVESGGYVFFDTLTYSNEFLPHLSEFVDIPKGSKLDFPCFSYVDLRYFFVRLRRSLSYFGYDISDSLRYFVASEYGTSEEYTDSRGFVRVATHRPHYHVLFFVSSSALSSGLNVATLRHAVDIAWSLGRTDRVRLYGVHANYFKANNHSDINTRSVSSYVAKYVQKLSSFQDEINWRLTQSLKYIYLSRFRYAVATDTTYSVDALDFRSAPSILVRRCKFVYDSSGFDSFIRSQFGKKILSDLKRYINQFHRQSKGFGLSALQNLDLLQIMDTGLVSIPDSLHITKQFQLPYYYKRHLFYEKVLVDGVRMWQLNDFGYKFRVLQDARVCKSLENKFRCLESLFNYRSGVDLHKLAHYCVYKRFRYNGSILSEPTIMDKLRLPNIYYNYSCPTDKSVFHEAYITRSYYGMSGSYKSHVIDDGILLKEFLRKHMIVDNHFEKILRKFDVFISNLGSFKDSLFNYLSDSRNRLSCDYQYSLCI